MKKSLRYFYFLFLLVTVSCGTGQKIVEDYRTKTYLDRTAYFAENPLTENGIVFLGNSITQAGDWSAYFPGTDVANRGISGDNTEGILARLNEITAAKPRKLFIMAGINDISKNVSTLEIIENYHKIIQTVKTESPTTRIFIQSLLPINNDFKRYKRLIGKEKQLLQLNEQLYSLAQSENATFINLFPFFVDAEGKLQQHFTGDGLHLKPDAYLLWTNIIRRFVE